MIIHTTPTPPRSTNNYKKNQRASIYRKGIEPTNNCDIHNHNTNDMHISHLQEDSIKTNVHEITFNINPSCIFAPEGARERVPPFGCSSKHTQTNQITNAATAHGTKTALQNLETQPSLKKLQNNTFKKLC